MALLSSQLRKQVDLPTWEWLRFSPVPPTTGVSCSCAADNSLFNETNGRYIYYLLNATNFWRYDTIADTYQQLATPIVAPASYSSMRFAGAQGYYNRVISATSNTITTGLPFGGSALGYKIRILSGKGAGQERHITAVSDPIVADYGSATAGSTLSLTDTAKTWTTGYVGAILNVNNWVGYVVRTLFGTGAGQVRKILYNSATVLTTGDTGFVQNDPFANISMIAPAAGTLYQIESSTITVDTEWSVIPDASSRFVIQSGGIWLQSGTAAPFYTMQYYDVLHDVWYSKPALSGMVSVAGTDSSLERLTENSTLWYQDIATGGSTTTLVDSTANWTVNEWAGYQLFIYSGNARNQIATITSNTSTTLTFPAMATAPDATSRFQIIGYDGGISTGSNLNNTFKDTVKSWPINRWANYAVRILGGAGDGQIRTILSNTSDTLTLYTPWNVLPDETSEYSIQGATDVMYLSLGNSSELFQYNTGNLDLMTHGRLYESGVASVAAALLCDENHTIYEQMPFAITSLAGTTTITATTAQAHNFKVGQYVSIRGITSGNDQYNVTGVEQITTVPSTTTFTYAPTATGSGAYTYLPALSTTSLSDASKDFRDNLSSANTTSLTFTRTTPSNINGWYVTGTNITPGTTVLRGGGTTTLTLSATQGGTPSGIMTFTPWGPTTAISHTFTGGGANVATANITSGVTNANINGWYAVGTGIAVGATVTSGAGTATLIFSSACTGAVSGTVTFYPPNVSGRQIVMTTTAPAINTGITTGYLMQASSSGVGGASMGFLAAITTPLAAVTRYAVTSKELLGAALDGTTTTYNCGVVTGGSASTLQDTSAFWSSGAATGVAQGTTITLGAPSPGNINGWYVSGTGVGVGAIILSGQGTNTLTVNIPHSTTLSGTITFSAWNQSLVGRRVKIQSGASGSNQELVITAVTPTTGTLTFSGVAPTNNVSVYSLLSIPLKGAGHCTQWISSNSVKSTQGKYIMMARGGGSAGFDRLDLTTDRVTLVQTTPFFETLTTGSMFAYDGYDRLYFTKDLTQRMYYLDVNTNRISGAGVVPYVAGGTSIGNRMEIFTTVDGLKYMWINRHAAQEHFRQLIFW